MQREDLINSRRVLKQKGRRTVRANCPVSGDSVLIAFTPTPTVSLGVLRFNHSLETDSLKPIRLEAWFISEKGQRSRSDKGTQGRVQEKYLMCYRPGIDTQQYA